MSSCCDVKHEHPLFLFVAIKIQTAPLSIHSEAQFYVHSDKRLKRWLKDAKVGEQYQ